MPSLFKKSTLGSKEPILDKTIEEDYPDSVKKYKFALESIKSKEQEMHYLIEDIESFMEHLNHLLDMVTKAKEVGLELNSIKAEILELDTKIIGKKEQYTKCEDDLKKLNAEKSQYYDEAKLSGWR
jgi:chromosome segregation ATPase